MKEHWTIWLQRMNACYRLIAYARRYRTVGEAWCACTNISWMYWLALNLGNARCLSRALEVFGPLSMRDERRNAHIDPDYFRSAFPTPTLKDLRDAVACRPSPWVATCLRKER